MVGRVFGSYEADRVTDLPDMANFTDGFKLYSGYLSVRGSGKYLHYMFAQSQNDPAKDPLLIWFNGGPGCSSMLGYLQEHGPYVMEDETTTFHKNDYSWNREANIVYIESPAGVGFSYCDSRELCNFDDSNSSYDNLDALLSFFAKFPEFRHHDLFITGESYAGVYVPYLALRIDQYNTDAMQNPSENKIVFNLKGIIVGSGVTNWQWDGDQAYVEIAKYHGIYGTELEAQMKANNCNYYYEDYKPEDTPECAQLYKKFKNLTARINIYDFYRRCLTAGGKALQDEPTHGQVIINDQVKVYRRQYSTLDYTPWVHERYVETEDGKPRLQRSGLLPCIFGLPIIDWINRPEIRTNLHIPDNIQAWEMCTDNITYIKIKNASEWIYPLLKNKYRILFYSGTNDGAVPTRGSRQWITRMNWDILKPYRQYYYNDQVAGYIEERDGLTFATVHGVGHMAPQWKRAETYYLIFNWLQGKDI